MRTIQRVKDLGEVFTPPELVNEILDKFPKDALEKGKIVCDPSCGNGNFLVGILKRKISLGHNPVTAISTIYGVDIMEDNVQECRERLYAIAKKNIKSKSRIKKIKKILNKNIVCADALTYDFEFNSIADYSFNTKQKYKIINNEIEKESPKIPDNYCSGIFEDEPYEKVDIKTGWKPPSDKTTKEHFRIVKPGSFSAFYSSSNNSHYLIKRLKKAGFEIIDIYLWIYSTGILQGNDISKDIDKQQKAERKRDKKVSVGGRMFHSHSPIWTKAKKNGGQYVGNDIPITEEAKLFSGYYTKMRPAYEKIIFAFKPLDEKCSEEEKENTRVIKERILNSSNVIYCPKPSKTEKDAGLEGDK